jgi:hypothetical protein
MRSVSVAGLSREPSQIATPKRAMPHSPHHPASKSHTPGSLGVQVCLVGDMITEEALPTYMNMLNTLVRAFRLPCVCSSWGWADEGLPKTR